ERRDIEGLVVVERGEDALVQVQGRGDSAHARRGSRSARHLLLVILKSARGLQHAAREAADQAARVELRGLFVLLLGLRVLSDPREQLAEVEARARLPRAALHELPERP